MSMCSIGRTVADIYTPQILPSRLSWAHDSKLPTRHQRVDKLQTSMDATFFGGEIVRKKSDPPPTKIVWSPWELSKRDADEHPTSRWNRVEQCWLGAKVTCTKCAIDKLARAIDEYHISELWLKQWHNSESNICGIKWDASSLCPSVVQNGFLHVHHSSCIMHQFLWFVQFIIMHHHSPSFIIMHHDLSSFIIICHHYHVFIMMMFFHHNVLNKTHHITSSIIRNHSPTVTSIFRTSRQDAELERQRQVGEKDGT